MPQYQSIHEIVRRAELNYLQGQTRLGKYVNWQMHNTIETIDAYLNSKHTSGLMDSLGREKPFFNIVTSATNIWYRATKIDRKDIKFVPTNNASVVLAFVANVMLQNWMNESRFGMFLNLWGRSLARYGSSVPKFVERDGKLIPTITPWNRIICDPINFKALPYIEKLYLTPAELRKNKLYDQNAVDRLINAKITRRTLDKMPVDILPEFIEVYEVHGEMDARHLQEQPDYTLKGEDIQYVQLMHVISYFQESGTENYDDFCLYRGREKKDPVMLTHLIEEDGRTLAIGAVEYLFDAQWMQNHTVKNLKDYLDIASRLIFQTADTHFIGRNVLSAIESGDVMIHELNKPLEIIGNSKPADVNSLLAFRTMWDNLGQELTATPDAMRGTNPPNGTPYGTTNLTTAQSTSLFEVMTENKGLHLEDMMREFVIPYLKKQLKNKKQVVGILDDAGISEIDSMYIPHEAIRRYNKRTAQQALDYILNPKTNDGSQVSPIQPFNPEQEQGTIKQNLSTQGNKRFFSPDDIDDKTWDDLFSDFEWDAIKVEITSENGDKQMILNTLSTVLQTIASNPAILQDPNAKMVFSQILNQTGVVSPLQLQAATSAPAPQQGQQPQGGQSVNSLQAPAPTPSPLANIAK
jgi:hypothetical protein